MFDFIGLIQLFYNFFLSTYLDWGDNQDKNLQIPNDNYKDDQSNNQRGRKWTGQNDFHDQERFGQRSFQNSHSSLNATDTSNLSKESIYVNSHDVGKLIGRAGCVVNEIRSKSGAKIFIPKENFGNDAKVEISGTIRQIEAAKNLIKNITQVYQRPKRCSSPLWVTSKAIKSDTEKNTESETIDWSYYINKANEAEKAKLAALPPIIKEFYTECDEISSMTNEEVQEFRFSNNNIAVSHFEDDDTRIIPKPIKDFRQAFSKFPEILSEIEKAGFTTPSPIQSQSWPILLKGMDLIGIAQTGTGKTLAYLLPALIHIDGQST